MQKSLSLPCHYTEGCFPASKLVNKNMHSTNDREALFKVFSLLLQTNWLQMNILNQVHSYRHIMRMFKAPAAKNELDDFSELKAISTIPTMIL